VALAALAEGLDAPLPEHPQLHVVDSTHVLDDIQLRHANRHHYPDSPDLYIGVPGLYHATNERLLTAGAALALLYQRRARMRTNYTWAGGIVAAAGLATSLGGGYENFTGHPWGTVVEKVGYAVFFLGGGAVTYAHTRSDPVVPDLSGFEPPIRVVSAS
jgi:hypothetical protein